MRALRWWLGGIAVVAVGLSVAVGARHGPGRQRLGIEARALGFWAAAEVADPLPRVGPLRGAALVDDLPGRTAAEVWADQPGQARTVGELTAALRSAKPVLLMAPTWCPPTASRELVLLPVNGPEVDVRQVWPCPPAVRTAGGFSMRVTSSPEFVGISVGRRDLGVFRAPGLAAAFAAPDWPKPPAVPLTVSPAACPTGCTLTVTGHGLIDPTTQLYIETDAGRTPLPAVPTHDGDFTWTGPLPAGVPPGNALIEGNGGQADLTVLPLSAPAAAVVAGPIPAVALLPPANLAYPPAAPEPEPTAVAVAGGKAIWVGGVVCAGSPAVCSAAAWVSTEGGSTWAQAFTDPGASAVSAMAFADSRTGVLADGHGLWRTADGGAHWGPVALAGASPVGLAVPDAEHVDVVGADGRLRWSTHGGVRWMEGGQACPAGDKAVGLSFRTPTQGQVACVDPSDIHSAALTIRATGDGGRTWAARAHGLLGGVAAAPLSVAFDGRTLWAAGLQAFGSPNPMVQKSVNGGRTWDASRPLGVPYAMWADVAEATPGVAIWNGGPIEIWPAGTGAAVYGGTPARELFGPATPGPSAAIPVSASGAVFAGGGDGDPGMVLDSADGGRTWTELHRFAGARVDSVSFPDAGQGWAVAYPTGMAGPRTCPGAPPTGPESPIVGAPFGPPCLLHTTDGGRTFAVVSPAPPDPQIVHFFSVGSGVLVTRAGAVYRTGDGGRTWNAWGVAPHGSVRLDFGSPDFGVGAIQDMSAMARLAVTTDGGRDWETQSLGQGQVFSLSVPAPGVVWALMRVCSPASGCSAQVLRTADGGRTWSARALGEALTDDLPQRPFQVVGITADAAWLLVSGRVPYRTLDGGRTWAVSG